jgi:hypothetical protein
MFCPAHRKETRVGRCQLQSTRCGKIKSTSIGNHGAYTRAAHRLFDRPESRAGIVRWYINQERTIVQSCIWPHAWDRLTKHSRDGRAQSAHQRIC